MHTNITKVALSIIFLGGLATGQAQQAQSMKVKLDTSYVFARGDYGLAQDTDVSLFLANPTVEMGDWRVQVSIPYVFLSGPATVVGNTGSSTPTRSEHGLGDLTLAATYKLETDENGWSSELTAKVKLPTADDAKGLGTGETDYIVQVDVFHGGGKVTPYATLGYQFLGSSASYPMKDGLFAAAGVAGSVSPQTTVGAGVNWRQAIVTGGESGFEAMAFVQRKLSETSRVQFFVLHGFTDASPTLALGATLGLSF